MRRLQSGDIVFCQTADSDNIDNARAQFILAVVTESDIQEKAGQEADNEATDGSAREQFEVEMALAEQPITDATKQPDLWRMYGRIDRFVWLAHL